MQSQYIIYIIKYLQSFSSMRHYKKQVQSNEQRALSYHMFHEANKYLYFFYVPRPDHSLNLANLIRITIANVNCKNGIIISFTFVCDSDIRSYMFSLHTMHINLSCIKMRIDLADSKGKQRERKEILVILKIFLVA